MLQKFNKFVFTPGHGGGDPGAVSGTVLESNNVTKICRFIDEISRSTPIDGASIAILDRDNNLGLQSTINEANNLYRSYDNKRDDNTIIFEIHQDMNAPHLEDEKEKKQMGVYYFNGDPLSANIADAIVNKFISFGSYNVNDGNLSNFNGTWRQDHYLDWAGYHLGFIHHTNPLSMIIECGFVSGNHSDDELKTFAKWIYSAIYELKTGKTKQQIMYDNEKNKFNSIIERLQGAGIYDANFVKDAVRPRLDMDGMYRFTNDFITDELIKQFNFNREKTVQIKELSDKLIAIESKPQIDQSEELKRLNDSLEALSIENFNLKQSIDILLAEKNKVELQPPTAVKITTSDRNPFIDFVRWIQSYKSDLLTSFLPFAISIGILPASASTGRWQDIIAPIMIALNGYLLHSNTVKKILNIFKK
jgi:hypothetical protein